MYDTTTDGDKASVHWNLCAIIRFGLQMMMIYNTPELNNDTSNNIQTHPNGCTTRP